MSNEMKPGRWNASLVDSIFNKGGALTPDEYDQVKGHPVAGEIMLAPVESLRPALQAVRGHHERFDGRGYPDGLAKDQTPLPARILAVADTYDAMTSDRSYRTALGDDVAHAEIRTHAGTQFDPACVQAFEAARRSGALERARHSTSRFVLRRRPPVPGPEG